MKAIKSDSDSDKKRSSVFEKKREETGMTPQNWRLKRSPGFSGKNRGVTPQLPPRVSPTLVTPLVFSNASLMAILTGDHPIESAKGRHSPLGTENLINNQP